MKNKSFEEAIEELEKVVDELENSNLTLDESVKRFQTGVELSTYCNKLLDDAEKKISILLEKNDGTIDEKDFALNQEENNKNDDME